MNKNYVIKRVITQYIGDDGTTSIRPKEIVPLQPLDKPKDNQAWMRDGFKKEEV